MSVCPFMSTPEQYNYCISECKLYDNDNEECTIVEGITSIYDKLETLSNDVDEIKDNLN